MSDKKVLEILKSILRRGNSAEVKQRTDGSIVIYEVKKNKATS